MPNPRDAFKAPENEKIKIWRYMDFSKFVSFLSSKSLYFSRADLLGDLFEASYPGVNKKIRESIADGFIAEVQKSKFELPENWKESFLTDISRNNQFIAKSLFVNCWHMNDDESFAMWKIYVKDSKGIAIRSTYQLLHELLPDDISIGIVNYIDYNTQPLVEGDFLAPIVHKRKAFMYEHELRAVKFLLDAKAKNLQEPTRKGIEIPIDINRLVSEIYVSPSSEEWFYNLVTNVSKKYSLDVPVHKSPLDEVPFF